MSDRDYKNMSMGDAAKALAKALLIDLLQTIEGGEPTSQDRAVARDVCDRLGVLNLADSDQLAELRKLMLDKKKEMPPAAADDDDRD